MKKPDVSDTKETMTVELMAVLTIIAIWLKLYANFSTFERGSQLTPLYNDDNGLQEKLRFGTLDVHAHLIFVL